jgi:hypothetical protein
MGGCCTSSTYAFRDELGLPFLEEKSNQLNDDSLIVKLKLHKLEKLDDSANSVGSLFVELRLLPQDKIGDQKQRASSKTSFNHAKWIPPERFQFILTSKENTKILISIIKYTIANKIEPVADAIVPCKAFQLGTNFEDKKIKLIRPTDGECMGEVYLDIHCISKEQAASEQIHTIYEYQRFVPFYEWGSSSHHLLPSDRGRWSTLNGNLFDNDIEKIAPKLNSLWSVSKTWTVHSTDVDPDGWYYARDFYSSLWVTAAKTGMVCRRRIWEREVTKPIESKENPRKKSFLETLSPRVSFDVVKNNSFISRLSGR